MVSQGELASIEGFDDDLSTELINRAKNFLEKEKEENTKFSRTKVWRIIF